MKVVLIVLATLLSTLLVAHIISIAVDQNDNDFVLKGGVSNP